MEAATDQLTGVLNRRGFFQVAAIVMERNRRSLKPVSVLAFDLDHFKSINDRWGHAVGDSVLQLFATVVRKTMRAGDVISRVGGEEFVAILLATLTDAALYRAKMNGRDWVEIADLAVAAAPERRTKEHSASGLPALSARSQSRNAY